MYRFPWYLTLVSTNHASSNPGQMFKLVGMGSIPSCTNTLGHNITEEKFILLFENGKHFGQDEKPLTLKSHSTFAYFYLI